MISVRVFKIVGIDRVVVNMNCNIALEIAKNNLIILRVRSDRTNITDSFQVLVGCQFILAIFRNETAVRVKCQIGDLRPAIGRFFLFIHGLKVNDSCRICIFGFDDKLVAFLIIHSILQRSINRILCRPTYTDQLPAAEDIRIIRYRSSVGCK